MSPTNLCLVIIPIFCFNWVFKSLGLTAWLLSLADNNIYQSRHHTKVWRLDLTRVVTSGNLPVVWESTAPTHDHGAG